MTILLGSDTNARHIAAGDMVSHGVTDDQDIQLVVTALLGE
jgi:hypothetical protein